MTFGTRLCGTEPEAILAKATRAESLGYDSLWRGDHLLLPDSLAAVPGGQGGRQTLAGTTPILDVMAIFAYLASATRTIRLATGIYLLPLRDPVQVARTAQTVDILSGGRLILGVGTGWLREEFELLGRDFASRGEITDEAIALIRALWTQERPSFNGRFFQVSGVAFEPKPVQRAGPPIVAGGDSQASLRRAASLCDGWYSTGPTSGELPACVHRLRQLLNAYGRADDPFEITLRVEPSITPEAIKRFEEAGVTRLVAEIGEFAEPIGLEDIDEMERFADRAMHS